MGNIFSRIIQRSRSASLCQFCLFACLSVCLFVCLSVCLFVCLSVCLPCCLPISLICSDYLPTPFRDGLNRLPMEFTLARHQAGQLLSSAQHTRTAGESRNSKYTILYNFFRHLFGSNSVMSEVELFCSLVTEVMV